MSEHPGEESAGYRDLCPERFDVRHSGDGSQRHQSRQLAPEHERQPVLSASGALGRQNNAKAGGHSTSHGADEGIQLG